MCGRFGLWLEEGIYHRFNIATEIGEIPRGYNIAPGMNALVVTRNSPNRGEVMRWGLIPPWARDIKIGYKMINARAETITERPAYRNCLKTKRCLVPFNAFYEWSRSGKDKTPYLFHDKAEPYLSFAGLYEIAHDGDNKEIKSFTIITTQANQLMNSVHERMPVILTQEEEEMWLDKESSQEKLLALLDGYKSQTFESYEVSTRVNSAQNNDAGIIEPLV
jgi:putative SOS response-associated peptidase YedK